MDVMSSDTVYWWLRGPQGPSGSLIQHLPVHTWYMCVCLTTWASGELLLIFTETPSVGSEGDLVTSSGHVGDCNLMLPLFK